MSPPEEHHSYGPYDVDPHTVPRSTNAIRIKMGLCEGVPGSVMPDHRGRADFHGACFNQAARFMDAGVMCVGGGGV